MFTSKKCHMSEYIMKSQSSPATRVVAGLVSINRGRVGGEIVGANPFNVKNFFNYF